MFHNDYRYNHLDNCRYQGLCTFHHSNTMENTPLENKRTGSYNQTDFSHSQTHGFHIWCQYMLMDSCRYQDLCTLHHLSTMECTPLQNKRTISYNQTDLIGSLTYDLYTWHPYRSMDSCTYLEHCKFHH